MEKALDSGSSPQESSQQSSNNGRTIINYVRYKGEWFEWCESNAPSVAKTYQCLLDKALGKQEIRSPQELRRICDKVGGDPNTLNAIRNFLRFLIDTGRAYKSDLINYQAVVKPGKSKASNESEMYVNAADIKKAYHCIQGNPDFQGRNIKEERQLVYKVALFTGMRVIEAIYLLRNFDPEKVEKAYRAYNIPRELQEKVAIYPMEDIVIPTRKSESKRVYMAYFPRELLSELKQCLGITKKTMDNDRVFGEDILDLKQLRKWTYNFIVDRAENNQDGELAEFLQGRTSEQIGTRHYRFKVRRAAEFYCDKILDPIKEELEGLL